jgi:hypothetical protein
MGTMSTKWTAAATRKLIKAVRTAPSVVTGRRHPGRRATDSREETAA